MGGHGVAIELTVRTAVRADDGSCYAASIMRPERTRQPVTYADLLKVPDHLVAEILDGESHVNPRPSPRHADASSGIGGVLWGPFDRGRGSPGGGRILDEPELHLAADVNATSRSVVQSVRRNRAKAPGQEATPQERPELVFRKLPALCARYLADS